MINSVTGYKSANMIGSRSNSGIENLAIFAFIIYEDNNINYKINKKI